MSFRLLFTRLITPVLFTLVLIVQACSGSPFKSERLGMYNKFIFISMLLFIFILGSISGNAAEITVSPGSGPQAMESGNNGVCTLHEAAMNAKFNGPNFPDCTAGTGDDTIILHAETYNINESSFSDSTGNSAFPEITDILVVRGAGANKTILSRDPNAAVKFRMFLVGSTGNLTLRNLTIQNGDIEDNAGGAVYSKGNLTIDSCYLTNNKGGDGRCGGAIFHSHALAPGNTLNVSNSTFHNNSTGTGGFGGAICSRANNTVIYNTTFSENHAPGGHGGAFDLEQYSDLQVSLTNNTFWKNDAQEGGGVYLRPASSGPKTYLLSNIFANNNPQNCSTSDYTAANNNLDTDNSCGFDAATNVVNQTDAKLSPLQDNGGSTTTHALLTGSPAIDAGEDNVLVYFNVDQRGYVRKVASSVDIGAVEFDPSKDTPTGATGGGGGDGSTLPQGPTTGTTPTSPATGQESGGCLQLAPGASRPGTAWVWLAAFGVTGWIARRRINGKNR